MKKVLATVLSCVLAVSCLAGCGSSDAKKAKVVEIRRTPSKFVNKI